MVIHLRALVIAWVVVKRAGDEKRDADYERAELQGAKVFVILFRTRIEIGLILFPYKGFPQTQAPIRISIASSFPDLI